MAENTQTFILVGQFKDGITPSLRKLDTQIGSLTKRFSKFSQTLRPISKELGVMAMASERMAQAQKANRNVFEGNTRVLREYKKTIGDVGRAQTALSRNTPRSLPLPKQPVVPGAGRGGVGGGGLPAAAAMVAGERAGDKGMGFWGMTAAMATANLAVNAATAGFQKLTNSLTGFVMGGAQAEQAVIQMSGTIMTLGKVGSFAKSREIADSMMGELGKVAAALPGSTEDYLSILQQTLDDQIEAFGSVEAVNKNLAGFDPKTGEKLAGGAEQSFTALMGMSAQLAGMRPEIAAMDLVQLKQNPENIRQVQLLTRNPTLAKFYKEELKNAGGNFILALNKAMQRAIPKEQIEALKNSFDSAYQSFITTFTDKYSGVFAPMRKVKIKVFKSMYGFEEQTFTTMDLMGALMKKINDILEMLMGMNLLDPMQILNEALFELLVWVNMFAITMEDLKKAGDLNIGTLAEAVGNAIGMAIANMTNYVLNLDYAQFFKDIDTLVYNFFKGLFEGFIKNFTGVEAEHGGIFGGIGTSVSGTIVTLSLFGLAIAKILPVIAAVGSFLFNLPALLAGLATVFQVAAPMVMTFVSGVIGTLTTAFTVVIAPVLAVAGAIMGLIAIFRHLDFIASSLWEALKMAGNGLMWLWHGFQELLARLKAGLFKFLSSLPFVGGQFKAAAAQAEKEAQTEAQRRKDREAAMGRNAAKIADNTAKSWQRTQEDAAKLREKLSGLGKGTAEQQAAAAKAAAALGELEAAAKKTAEVEKPANKPVEKPQGTPTINNRNYTVGGVTYDWKTGKPVSGAPAAPKPAATTPAPAGGGQGGKRGSGAKPTAPKPVPVPKPAAPKPVPVPKPAAPKPAVQAPAKPAAPVTATIPAAALQPVQQAVSTGTSATQSVRAAVASGTAATQAVGTAVTTSGTQVVAAINGQSSPVTAAINALGTSMGNMITALKTEITKQAVIQQNKTNTLINGINNVKSALMAVSAKVPSQSTVQQIAANTAKTNEMLAGGKVKVKFDLVGGPQGGTPGAVDAFTPVATSQFGLQVTSGYRPGDPGYHGVNRARDYSNGTGPTPQMMAFAKMMASSYGSQLSELIYTPLGFSIKNGQVVPPYAQAAHYNHVHVALANGLDMPRLFTSAAAAANYESMMAPPGARIATVTANSSEYAGGGGAPVTLNQTVNVNGSSDPRATAEAVWQLTAKAVQQLQANNYG